VARRASAVSFEAMTEDAWASLIDGPIGAIIDRVQEGEPTIATLIDSPRRLLAFRTFAYIRVGMLLGSLLVERDFEPREGKGAENWAEQLIADPACYDEVVREVLAVAEETAAEPGYAGETAVGPDAEERARFLEFAKRHLATDA
jgi:hypothetical protein